MAGGKIIKYKKRPLTFPRGTIPSKGKKLTAPQKAQVKKIVDNKLEKKEQELVSATNGIYTLIDSSRVFKLTPIMTQSSGQGDRIGNEITLTRAMLYINIYANDTAPNASSPHYVDIYIFKCRKSNFVVPTATDISRFLQKGNSADSYNGETWDGMRALNDDLFILKKHKRYSMINCATVTNLAGLDTFKATRQIKINILKYLKKKVLFDDTNSFECTNDNLYIACGSTLYNQGAIPPADTSWGTYDYLVSFKYTDA